MQHLQNPCCNVAWDCYFLVSTRLCSFKFEYNKLGRLLHINEQIQAVVLQKEVRSIYVIWLKDL